LSKQMSKTINLHNNIERKRNGKYSSALTKEKEINTIYAEHAKYNEPITKDEHQSKKKPKAYKSKLWLIGAIFALFIALNFILSFTLFAMMHKYKSEAHNTFAGLNEIKGILNENIKKVDSFADDIKQLGLDAKRLSNEAQGISAAIKELIQKSDSQSFAIDNLTKAKNNLFNRITTLEAELEKTKNNKKVLP